MDSDALAARRATLHLLSLTSSRAGTDRAIRRRAADFIARAGEFDARVHFSAAPRCIGANSVLLWFRAKQHRSVTLLSLSGVIEAEIAAIQSGISAYNDRRAGSSARP